MYIYTYQYINIHTKYIFKYKKYMYIIARIVSSIAHVVTRGVGGALCVCREREAFLSLLFLHLPLTATAGLRIVYGSKHLRKGPGSLCLGQPSVLGVLRSPAASYTWCGAGQSVRTVSPRQVLGTCVVTAVIVVADGVLCCCCCC